MAENMTGILVENTMVAGAPAKHAKAYGRQIGISGLIAAVLVAVLMTGVTMHNRQASQPTAPAISRAVTSQQIRFLEDNTTNLPNAVAAERAPVVTSSQQRFLEANTTTLPNAVAISTTAPITTQAQRFWEVNTMLPVGSSYPNAEDMTPLIGHPR